MKKEHLNSVIKDTKTEIRDALQIIVDELNQGQQKKIVKNKKVKELLDNYGVEYSK